MCVCMCFIPCMTCVYAIVFKASLERRGCHEFGEYGVALALEASLSPDLDAQDAMRRVREKGGS
jgi:hypothetical protein